MNSFIYAINKKNEVISINPKCHYYSFDKDWCPLMPYVMEYPLEMGVYCLETNERFPAPFVWNCVRIVSLEKDESREGYNWGFVHKYVYKIEVAVYPNCYCNDEDKKMSLNNIVFHTFYLKNGLFFFLDSVLGTINRHIMGGNSIDSINFDFLDEQCEKWNFLAANDQPRPHFEFPSECYPSGYYSLIEEMDIAVYEDGIGHRNGDSVWKEASISLKTVDEYVIDLVSKVLMKYKELNHTKYEDEKKTLFSFRFDEERDENSCCRSYSKLLVDTLTMDKIKRRFIKELIVDGLSFIFKTSAIEYYSTRHSK